MIHVGKIIGLALFIVLAFTFIFPVKAAFMFADNFNRPNGLPGSGWTVISGDWEILDKELLQSVVDGSYERGQIAINGFNAQDFSVEANVTFLELDPNGWAYVGFAVRYVDEDTFYWIVLKQTADGNGEPNSNLKLELRAKFNYLVVVDLGFVGELGTSYKLKAEVAGDAFKIYVDGALQIETADATFGNAGGILMWTGRCKASFDDVFAQNPGFLNVVPEPAPVVISVLLLGTLATYIFIRKRSSSKTVINLP